MIFKSNRQLALLISLTIFIILYIYFVFKLGADTIVSFIGVENSYLVIFLVAIIGGVSALTSTSFYVVFVTFLLGGSNPIVLSLIAGIGLTIGDSVFYYFGSRGRTIAKKSKYEKYVTRVHKYVNSFSKYWIFGIVVAYASLPLPLPKDIICIGTGILKYDIKLLLSGLFIGNLIHLLLISVLLIFFNINVV